MLALNRRSELPAHDTEEALRLRELLAFVLNGEAYAFPLAAVREILKPPPITPVPRAPRNVLGVVSVRGVITTVIDLRSVMNVEQSGLDKHTRILLVSVGDEVMGALVDKVHHVHRLDESEVELTGALGSDLSSHVLGIGRPRLRGGRDGEVDGDILILLDPQCLAVRR